MKRRAFITLMGTAEAVLTYKWQFRSRHRCFVHGGRHPFASHLEKPFPDFWIGDELGKPHTVARIELAVFIGCHRTTPPCWIKDHRRGA